MLQTTFWPRGSRHQPVEEVSDLLGPKLGQATPNEAGMPVRENGKPLTLVMGRCHHNCKILVRLARGLMILYLLSQLAFSDVIVIGSIPLAGSLEDCSSENKLVLEDL